MNRKQGINFDQTLILALKLHDRTEYGRFKSLKAAFEIRKQINCLASLGIDQKAFEKIMEETKKGAFTEDWK